MIINVLANFVLSVINFITQFVSIVVLPDSVINNIKDVIDTLFNNFTVINIVCHLSYLKLILGIIVTLTAFRMALNLVRCIITKAHT